MDTFSAFVRGDIARARKAKMMIFDWDKAAKIIKEKGIQDASAGLAGDWEWTGGEILKDGKPVTDSYTYLGSL